MNPTSLYLLWCDTRWPWAALGSLVRLWEALGGTALELGSSWNTGQLWEPLGMIWEGLGIRFEALGGAGQLWERAHANPAVQFNSVVQLTYGMCGRSGGPLAQIP